MTVSEMPEVAQAGQERVSGKRDPGAEGRRRGARSRLVEREEPAADPFCWAPCFTLCSWWEYAHWIQPPFDSEGWEQRHSSGGCPLGSGLRNWDKVQCMPARLCGEPGGKVT